MTNLLAIVTLLVFGILFYSLTLRGVVGNIQAGAISHNLDKPTKPFELSPERDRYLLTNSLVEDKSFSLSKQIADTNYSDIGYYKGRFYILFAPGISLLASPLYDLGKHVNLSQLLSYATISLFAIANMVMLFQIAKKVLQLPILSSMLASLIFAFASTSWSYAITLYQHEVTTFCILSGFYAAWKFSKKSKLSALYASWVWVSYSLAIAVDYPNVLLMLPVMLYFTFHAVTLVKEKLITKVQIRPAFVLTSFLFIALTVLHGYYNQQNFGDWKKLSGSLVEYKVIKNEKLLTTTGGDTKIQKLTLKKQPIHFFKEENIPFGAYTMLIGPERGLFFFSPIFILGVFGLIKSLKNKTSELSTFLGLIGINIFLYASFLDPWGGWAFGPRYLIPSMAVLSLFAAFYITKAKHKIISRIAGVILFAYSSAIALLGALTTNAVPPKIEALPLHMDYNFLQNLKFLRTGQSSSFLFNNLFHSHINLTTYYVLLYTSLLGIFTAVVLLLPRRNHYEY